MPANSTRLWYAASADRWLNALPIGNGRLGTVAFGGTGRETIRLNEDSVWQRGPSDRNNPDALEHLPKVRRLLLAGRIQEAQERVFDPIDRVRAPGRRWRSGSIPGLHARGGFEVALSWRDGEVVDADIRSHLGVAARSSHHSPWSPGPRKVRSPSRRRRPAYDSRPLRAAATTSTSAGLA